ncbi:MAG: FAD-dependent oxidoreductase [Deltaproteobacteria bacterium]|nr:FAD-dependent oxidoreductase [Deltaproteobacteria bacterium]
MRNVLVAEQWKLLSPFQIGAVLVPNRIMMPAMHLNYHRGLGFADETLIAFYTERARGRAGLISIGGFAVELAGAGVFNSLLLGLWSDEYVPPLERLTKSMKAAYPEGKIACQLYHTGRVSPSKLTGLQPVGASAKRSRFNPEPVHALSTTEVRELEQKYIDAAARAVAAGFDCIDLFCGVGHLLNQFLSPATNDRSDEYGGTLQNRARIVVNILRGIRRRLSGTPIVVRLAGHDLVPGGNTHREAIEIARILEGAGAAAFNVTGGWHESRVPQITGEVPTGAYAWLAQAVRAAVRVAVGASNRINDPFVAERILRAEMADFVSMGRPLLADPHLPRKLMAGQLEDLVHCIACNVCLDTAWDGPARCLVNPYAGRELELSTGPAGPVRRVTVVGGGPAGMMAAKVAAARGHVVTLYERGSELGGVAAIGDVAPGKGEYRWLYEDLRKQVRAHPGIELRLGCEATVDLLRADRPDAVIIATGARAVMPELPGLERSSIRVYHAHDILAGSSGPLGDEVVVIGGGPTGCETALHLRAIGSLDGETVKFLLVHELMPLEELRQRAMIGRPQRNVTLVQRSERLAKSLNKSVRWTLLRALERAGVAVRLNSVVRAVEGNKLLVSAADKTQELIPCDTVVVATGMIPEDRFYHRLRSELPGTEIKIVGDALAPRQATEALLEAVQAATSV